MKPSQNLHPWDLTPREAMAVQKQLAIKVKPASAIPLGNINTVAGVDTHYDHDRATAAVVVLRLADLTTIDHAIAVKEVRFPYIPGLFTFREGPAIVDAFSHLTISPDLLIFDGQGIAHPRRCGLASHIGLLLDLPSIGCAKTRLLGRYIEPHATKGCYSYLKDGNETIGAAVRTRSRVKPVFVSIGHRINLRDSIKIVLRCCPRYRLPETTRRADRLARSNRLI
ncbi:MAG: deoxyribonuclease V [Desulfobacterales bacterium]